MKLEFRQTVTCNHLTLARVCKTIDWQQPLPRCGEYVTGLDTLDGEQELQVHKLLHRTPVSYTHLTLPTNREV